MKRLILLFAFVLAAVPLFAQDEGGGGIFSGGDLAAPGGPNAPAIDRLVSLNKILTEEHVALTPAQNKAINAMLVQEIKKYAADLEKKFPDEVAAARAPAGDQRGGRGGGAAGGGGRTGGGGGGFGGGADGGGGGGGGGRPAGGGGRGGGRGAVIPPNSPLVAEMAKINVELQAAVTNALTPEQQAGLKKYHNDQIRKAGGFGAMKLTMEEGNTPLTADQEAQIQALYDDQDQQMRQLTRDSQGQPPDAAKVAALKSQMGPKLLKVLNADQKKTLVESLKKQQAAPTP
jgi:hypothetical protein